MNEIRLTAPVPETRVTGQQPIGRSEPGVAQATSGVAAPDVSVALSAQSTGTQEAVGIQANAEKKETPAEQEQLESAVSQLNDYVQSVQRDLHFKLDSDSGETVVTVVDRTSDEVVRQIPDEVVLRLARNLDQDEPVQLFNAKA